MAEEQRHSSLGKYAGIAAISAAAGALATVMLTPKSGREMREEIKDKAAEAKDKTQNKLSRTMKR